MAYDMKKQISKSGAIRIVAPRIFVANATLDDDHPVELSESEWAAIRSHLRLSGRESQLAQHTLANFSEADIAKSLAISVHTVHSHFERLYRKLGVSSRCQLIVAVFATYIVLRQSKLNYIERTLAH